MPASMISTNTANTRATLKNTMSPIAAAFNFLGKSIVNTRTVAPPPTRLTAAPERLAGSVLDVRRPGVLDQLHQAVWKRHIYEVLGHFIAIGVGPVEELHH